jgi:hypothetical protein
MINLKRALVALAAMAAALAGFTLTAPASFANAPIGAIWSTTTPSGERVEFQKIDAVTSKSTATVKKAGTWSCPSNAVNGTAFCAWTDKDWNGAIYVYNMNNVYANTANGVAHVWNMQNPAHDNTQSWANFSNRYAIVYNWFNGNPGGNYFGMNGVTTTKTCESFPGDTWCLEGDYHASSIRAGA